MKFKASYFNICGTMIRENMRRFWPVPIIGFLIYFLSGVFPILMNYNTLDNLSSYISLSMSNQQPFFMVAHLFLPIIAAVLVFRYLHSTSSVSVMHAMPFTRPALFGSNFLSGLLLAIGPILVNGLILLVIAKPVYEKSFVYDEVTEKTVETMVNVFSRLTVCNWIWESFIIVLFIYSISIFAGIVTGNGLMHFSTAFAFNFLVPLLYITFLAYFEEYLFGFTYSGSTMDFFLQLSPYLHVFTAGGAFSLLSNVLYLGVSAVMIALSLFLYRRQALERAGDSLAFRFMEPIICYLFSFFTMSLFGIYFSSLDERSIYRYAGYAAGILVGFLVGQMVARKTVRIFNLASLRRFVVYCAAALLFILGLNFDVTGYEQRIPALTDISTITLNQSALLFNDSYEYVKENLADDKNTFKESENIILVQDFHHRLVDDKDSFAEVNDSVNFSTIDLTYNLKDGSRLSRSYTIPVSVIRSYTQLAPLYESKEYRKTPYISTLSADAFNYLNVQSDLISGSEGIGNSYETISDKDAIRNLAQALSKDLTNRPFSALIFDGIPLCSLEFGYAAKTSLNTANENIGNRTDTAVTPEAKAVAEYRTGDSNLFNIYADYTNTIAWMNDYGLSRYTQPAGTFAQYLVIKHYTADSVVSPYTDETTLPQSTVPDSTGDKLVLQDKEQIKEILRLSEENPLNYNDYYSVVMVLPTLEKTTQYGNTGYYYLNPENAPDYIKNYFN